MSKHQRAFSEHLTRSTSTLQTPKGMGDLLPPAAAAGRGLSDALLGTLGLAGYALVKPPLFEHASIVERGNETVDPRDLLRFVEPESGEVAVLRPDITPQVARIVATRLADHPGPFRLCYEGRVLRRRRGRARKHQQMTQVGVECIGIGSPTGDVEVIALASEACTAVGLKEHHIELGEATLIGSVLAEVPEDLRGRVSELMAVKDAAALRSLRRDPRIAKRSVDQLLVLLDHVGEAEPVLKSARRRFRSDHAKQALSNLQTVVSRLQTLDVTGTMGLDLAETRGLGYYTGVSFQVLATGPGEALCSGGRYDNLLARFGAAQPATGFALDVGNLQWALREAGRSFRAPGPARILLVAKDDDEADRIARDMRRSGVGAVPAPDRAPKRALAFARAWGYDAVLVCRGRRPTATRTGDEATCTFQQLDAAAYKALAAWAQAKEDQRWEP